MIRFQKRKGLQMKNIMVRKSTKNQYGIKELARKRKNKLKSKLMTKLKIKLKNQ